MHDHWKRFLAGHLAQETAFPLDLAIGKPDISPTRLASPEGYEEVSSWIRAWSQEPRTLYAAKTTRRTGALRYPNAVRFANLAELASWVGGNPMAHEAKTACDRFAAMEGIHPALRTASRHWPLVASLSDVQHGGLMAFLREQRDGGGHERLSARSHVIAGFHSKWIETHTAFLSDLAACMGQGPTTFAENDKKTLWIKTHPDDMVAPFGAPHFALQQRQGCRPCLGIRPSTATQHLRAHPAPRPMCQQNRSPRPNDGSDHLMQPQYSHKLGKLIPALCNRKRSKNA